MLEHASFAGSERRVFLIKVERGLAQADVGETIPHAEVKESPGEVLRIAWTFQAILDVQATCTSIGPESPHHAASMTAVFLAATDRLAICPLSGAVVPEFRDETIREMSLGVSRFVYRVTSHAVQILTVVHEHISGFTATS